MVAKYFLISTGLPLQPLFPPLLLPWPPFKPFLSRLYQVEAKFIVILSSKLVPSKNSQCLFRKGKESSCCPPFWLFSPSPFSSPSNPPASCISPSDSWLVGRPKNRNCFVKVEVQVGFADPWQWHRPLPQQRIHLPSATTTVQNFYCVLCSKVVCAETNAGIMRVTYTPA